MAATNAQPQPSPQGHHTQHQYHQPAFGTYAPFPPYGFDPATAAAGAANHQQGHPQARAPPTGVAMYHAGTGAPVHPSQQGAAIAHAFGPQASRIPHAHPTVPVNNAFGGAAGAAPAKTAAAAATPRVALPLCPFFETGVQCLLNDTPHQQKYAHVKPVKKRACFAEYLPCRIFDAGHRDKYLHTCSRALDCKDRTPEHLESVCHRCANDEDGQPCVLQSDSDHTQRYYHIHLLPNTPSPSEQARVHASVTNNGGVPLPMCQYRGACDILRNAHDHRRGVHFARWSHPVVDTNPLTGRAGAAANGVAGAITTIVPISVAAGVTLASTQCGNFPGACHISDAGHLKKFRHPCPNQLAAMDGVCPLKEESHYKNCIHACPNGYQCPLRDNDDQHNQIYYHYEARPESLPRGPCPIAYDCTYIEENAGVQIDPVSREPLTSDYIKEHRYLYQHPCELRADCNQHFRLNQVISGMRVESPAEVKRLQDHARLYFHKRREPCRQGNDCLIQGAHTSEFVHPCPYGRSCTNTDAKHQAERLHVCAHGHACTAKTDPNHASRFHHLDMVIPWCTNGRDCDRQLTPDRQSTSVHCDLTRHQCLLWEDCKDVNDLHLERYQHPCAQGATCTNMVAQHRWRYLHPCDTPDCKDQTIIHRRECSHATDEPISSFKFEYPRHWDAKLTGDPSYVELKAGSDEYKMVESKLAAGASAPPKITLVKLERYQSFQLLNRYVMQRSVINKRTHNKDKPPPEVLLWHAVTSDVMKWLLGDGVMRAPMGFNFIRGPEQGPLGKGIYMAPDAKTYTKTATASFGTPDASGNVILLLCLATPGLSQQGSVGLKRPPMQADGNTLYDSTHQAGATPTSPPIEYCFFDDAQAYPYYKLTLKLT